VVVIEASILARLLGLRLLRLDATVVLAPAEVTRRRNRPPPPGTPLLARANREIDEGADLLAEARQDSRPLSPSRRDRA
jgi:hypothetical protein